MAMVTLLPTSGTSTSRLQRGRMASTPSMAFSRVRSCLEKDAPFTQKSVRLYSS